LFGKSYLSGFAYMVAPNLSGARPPQYPNMRTRADNIVRAANTYGIAPINDYSMLFDDLPPMSSQPSEQFLLSVADEALQAVIDILITEADTLLSSANIDKPSTAEAERIYTRFKLVVPAENAKSLADILNAGWLAFEDDELWKE